MRRDPQNDTHRALDATASYTRMWLTLLVIGAVATWGGCRSDESPRAVRVGWVPLFYDLPHFVAESQALYRKNGVQVEPVRFQTSNDMVDALAAGRIDVATSASLTVLFSLEARFPGRFKLSMVHATKASEPTDYLLVKKEAPYQGISDLKGKRIGTFPGSTMRLYAELGLKPELSLPDDAALLELKPELQLLALLNGDIDALLTYDADGMQALASGQVRILAAGLKGRIMDPFPSGGYAFSSEYYSDREDSARAVSKALVEAVDFVFSHSTSARQTAASYLSHVSTAILSKLVVPQYWYGENIDFAQVQKFADLLYCTGEIPRTVNVRSLFVAR